MIDPILNGQGSGTAFERAIGEHDFVRFQRLIHGEAGIWLAPVKRALLVGRLGRRVRELGLTFAEYYQRVETDARERVLMLDCVTTNETHFFREPRQFEFLANELFPRWRSEAEQARRQRRIRIWSAACSTGEEPYSIAMALLRAFPLGSGWDLEILATDLSTRVLEQARSAVWPIEKSREIPDAGLKAFMLRGTGSQQGLMKAGPEIRDVVRFARLNLVDRAEAPAGPFDAIFCRNVLIYFDAQTKEQVVRRLVDRLAPGGHLLLGHAESVSGMGLDVQNVAPSIYARRRHQPAEALA